MVNTTISLSNVSKGLAIVSLHKINKNTTLAGYYEAYPQYYLRASCLAILMAAGLLSLLAICVCLCGGGQPNKGRI